MATSENNTNTVNFESERQDLEHFSLGSLLLIISVDTCATLICVCFIGVCVVYCINQRAKRKEERDKVGELIRVNYWQHEDTVNNFLILLNRLRQIYMFRDITALHILSFKYRSKSGIYGSTYAEQDFSQEQKVPEQYKTSLNDVIKILKIIERLFDSLTLELPCKGKCPSNITAAFGCTIYNIALSSALLWSDKRFRLIRNVVQYFNGKAAAESFDGNFISDEELETLVLARIPYVNQLYLSNDHFVLMDVDISNDLKIDLRNKIRYIDTVLGKNSRNLQPKEKKLIESYNAVREICMKNSFILNKNYLPDITSKAGEETRLQECVVLLRHLLRITCIQRNLKRVETDDKFFQFIMQLHETLYTWSDTDAMMEVIERTRNNIFCYLRGFTPEQMLIDKEFTKAKLEHLEKELYRHLNYLTLRQVQESKERRNQFRLLRSDNIAEHKIRSFDSESSVYTMAMSASSFMMQRQPSQDPNTLEGPVQQQQQQHGLDPTFSMDQASLVSSSSMYATAASISSGAAGQCENTPLMGERRSPPSPRSPNQQHRTRQQRNGMVDRAQSPISSTDSDFFETAV